MPALGIVPPVTGTRTRHETEVLALLEDQHADLLLPAIPRRVVVADAAVAGEPVTGFAPIPKRVSVGLVVSIERRGLLKRGVRACPVVSGLLDSGPGPAPLGPAGLHQSAWCCHWSGWPASPRWTGIP